MLAVFDTNVFVSALITPGGSGDRAIRAVLDGRVELATSAAILAETGRVLMGKFGWERAKCERAIRFIAAISLVTAPQCRLSILADEPDNRILECAVESGAELVVTGDRHLLDLGHIRSVRIVTLAAFLAHLP